MKGKNEVFAPSKFGRHVRFVGINGEMNQSPLPEGEQNVVRVSVDFVLMDSVPPGLHGHRILQFKRGDRNPVDGQNNVNTLARVWC